jgi:hypothetical protein|tara:strand:+ start:414 stop:581 length:168 start_codon:yes stop_codon:yes gene_type:complete
MDKEYEGKTLYQKAQSQKEEDLRNEILQGEVFKDFDPMLHKMGQPSKGGIIGRDI